MQQEIHRFRNNQTAIPRGNVGWQGAAEHHLLGIRVRVVGDDRFEDRAGHRFINMCSCSYLGLNHHPEVVAGAIDAIRREGVYATPVMRVRIQLAILDEFEAAMAQLYRARCISTLSCSVASMGVLPLIASGHLCDDGEPRVMVFDKYCHFSMNLVKPICADETTVLTAPHNDLDFVEDACKRHRRVAYVADGAYSMGGSTRLQGLLELQDRYGLFLYLDDSHSLSVWGERGEGFVRSQLGDELNPLTVVVGSQHKGFGTSGGVIMLGPVKHEAVLTRFGGPFSWSQGPCVAQHGGGLASVGVHLSPELGRLQRKLQENLALFDSLIETAERGNRLPIRLIPLGSEERAVECSEQLLARGFYSSAVFFPIVERGKAGLRVMVRADNRPEDILAFCEAVHEVVGAVEAPAHA
jgi:7-keto-8-aminopelargonate synthetase-like enzyme